MRGVLDLVDGETYTLSCFARVTSGTKARLVLAYGHNASGYVSSGYEGNHKYIDIENTTWERVVFSFIFHETATYEAAGANPYTVTVNHKKRVGFGVCRKWDGTVQLAGFRLTKGGLYGNNTIDTLSAEVEAARQESAAASAAAQAATTAANKVMTGATASAAGAAGKVPAPAAGDQLKYLRADGSWEDLMPALLSPYPVKAAALDSMNMLATGAQTGASDAASGIPPYQLRLKITASSASTAVVTVKNYVESMWGGGTTYTLDLTAANGGNPVNQNTIVDIWDGVRMAIGTTEAGLSQPIVQKDSYIVITCDVADVGMYYRQGLTNALSALEQRIAALENA